MSVFKVRAVLSRWLMATGVSVLCLIPLWPASAVTPSTAVTDLASLEGADRAQRLLAGAKKEGELTIYSSMAPDDMQEVSTAFEKKYGVKTRVWRASSEKVAQRIMTEAQGNRFDLDVVETNGPEMESLHREQLLQQVKSPFQKDLIPQAVLPHGEWVGTRLNVFVQAFNTNQVKKDELPKTFQDLLNPKWKGRLGIEAEDTDWFAAIVKEMGEEKGLKLFRDLISTNGLSVRKGHTLLTNLVASGEVPLALTVYNYKAEQLKNKGAPIDWFAIPPAIARPNGVGISRRAPHPHAAILFYDFMLSEAQNILAKRDFVPTSKKVDTNLNKMAMKFVDPAIMLDEYSKWEKLYQQIITSQAK